MGSVVVDSSVVIGFFDPDDAHHGAAHLMLASARQRGEHFVLAATVYTESLVGSYRHDEPTAADRRRRLLGLFGPVRAVDDAVADLAARLRATHRWLRTPDALVIATGIMDNAEIVTCDKRLADVDDRVKVLLSG